MKAPAFQFYAAEYLADERVQLMTIEEEGVYIRLLSYCWREGSIPADPVLLSRLCKGAHVDAMSIVTDAFDPKPGDPTRLIHTRLEKERVKQEQFRAKQSAKGAKSAEVRKANNHGSTAVQPETGVTQEPDGNSSSSSSSSTAVLPPPAPKRAATDTDDEWLKGIESMECYRQTNIRQELGKAQAWAQTNRRNCTRKFFINWLNRSLEAVRTIATRPASNQLPSSQDLYAARQ